MTEQVPWLMINLSAISKTYTTQVLCNNLSVHTDIADQFQTICLIQEITQKSTTEQHAESFLKDTDWQERVKANIIWAIKNLTFESKPHLQEAMFDREFVKFLTENMEKMEGFSLYHAKEVMILFVQLTMQATQDDIYEIESFFLQVQRMVKEMITNISEFPRNEVIFLVTQWAQAITEMIEAADKTFACPWVA